MAKKQTRGAMGGFAYALTCFVTDFILLALILVVFAYFHHVRQHEEVPIGITSNRYANTARTPGAQTPKPQAAASPSATGGAWPTQTARATPAITSATPSHAAPTEAPPSDATPSHATPSHATPSHAVPTEAPPSDATQAYATPSEAETLTGDFSALYPGMFTNGEIIESETENVTYYKSANVNLTFTRYNQNKLIYYVADFYIRDIENLKSALANDKYGLGQREYPASMARRSGALIAINGDQYSSRYDGYVIRNGMLYRDAIFRDICVLYWDGTMRTYSKLELTAQEAIEDGAYQVWSFGPRLLDEEGKPLNSYVTDVPDANPRTAIGYFAPGHYCFVVVEGRSDGSKGINIPDLAALMSDLGCMAAYNLDGGQTSAIVYKGELINRIKGGVRECSDIIMIAE